MIAEIRGIGSYVPEKIISNGELSQSVNTTDEWIYEHTGIRKRHIIAEGQTASDMALEAAKIALDRAQVSPDELDLIITATATPDYNNFPATACLIQHSLGAENAGAFDLAAGCTGFIYALSLARGMILAGDYRNILVIGVEALSRITNWQDRNTCVLFGDGAGAAVVSANNNQDNRGILQTMLRAEGAGGEHLMRKAGGSRFPYRPGMDSDGFLSMNGRRVYGFAVRVCTIVINSLLRKANLHLSDIKYIVPHQANERIIQAAAERLEVSLDKFYINIAEYANTSSASIPIALAEMEAKNLLRKGDLILTLAFGAGLTYGGLLIRW